MPKYLFLLLPLLLVLLTACGEQPTPPPTATPDPLLVDASPKTIDLVTDDGINLKATYYPPSNPRVKTPAILLVHMKDSNKEEWRDFALKLQDTGYAALAIDLRGHGESESHQFYTQMDMDVGAALQWLLTRTEIASDRLGIVGARLGANLALRAGNSHLQVKSLVLLSPGFEYDDVTTANMVPAYGKRALMLVASERDDYAAETARTLNTQALGQHQLQIYPGFYQGTDLLKAQAGLTPMLLAWFTSTL